MSIENVGVAVLSTHLEADNTVKELQSAGFNMRKISIVGKDYHTEEHAVGFYNSGDRMNFWGQRGAFWGGLWGVLFGSAFFFLPGIGPLVMAGPIVATIVGGLEGAVVGGGLSVLGAALYSIGIPNNSIVEYETSIKSDKFVVVVHGSMDELNRAKEILKKLGHHVEVHTGEIPLLV